MLQKLTKIMADNKRISKALNGDYNDEENK